MNKIPMVENACKELLQCGVFDRRKKCINFIKEKFFHRTVAKEDLIFWPSGLLAAGLWAGRVELSLDGPEARGIEGTLAAYYERWMKRGTPVAVIDDLLAGETLLAIDREIRKGSRRFEDSLSGEQTEAAVHKLASYAQEHPKDGAGSFFYRPAGGEPFVFVDGIGLACPFLYQYGEEFDRQEYRELALRQIANFLSYGMDGATGLPYHGYDTTDGCKYGIIGWGRAVGWLLRGMMGCMVSAYGRERLSASCIGLMDVVLAYQRHDGYFSWQLQAAEGPADTSATGMICAALKQGLALGVFAGEKYENALLAGQRALEKSVRGGLVYQCSGECEGFSRYPQHYGAYPWSLGPALAVF